MGVVVGVGWDKMVRVTLDLDPNFRQDNPSQQQQQSRLTIVHGGLYVKDEATDCRP